MIKKNIAILAGNIYSSYTNDFLFGVEKYSKSHNANVILFMGPHINCLPYYEDKIHKEHDNIVNLNKVFDYSVLSGADAIIVAYETLHFYMNPEKLEDVISQFNNIPVIIVGKKIDGYTCITTDNYTGIKKCVEHVIKHHNRKHICFISGPATSSDSQIRLSAYKETMVQNGLSVTDSMVCYGDYSRESADEIGKLIDNNPEIDALISANDTMAITAYNECEKRGLTVGKDISITGFDNIGEAKSVSPGLTSIEQNVILLGIKAAETAVNASNGIKCDDIVVPVNVIIRESCGRNHKHLKEQYFIPYLSLEENISHVVDLFEQNVFKKDFMLSDNSSRSYIEAIIRYITDIYYDSAKSEYSIFKIKEYLDKAIKISEYNISFFSMELTYLITCILFTKNTFEKRIQLSQFITQIQDYIHNKEDIILETKFAILQGNLWNTPTIISNVTNNIKNEENIFRNFIKTLVSMHIRKAYIFLNREPIFISDSQSICPDSLELVIKYDGITTTYYNKSERINLSRTNTLSDILDIGPEHQMGVYNIFTDNFSYGILVCENEPTVITGIYCASFQLATAIYLYNIMEEQFELRGQLQKNMVLQDIKDIF